MIDTTEKPTTLEYLLPKATKVACGKRTWSRRNTRSIWHPEQGGGSVPVNNKTLILQIRDMCENHWQADIWLHFDTLDKQAVLLTEGSVL